MRYRNLRRGIIPNAVVPVMFNVIPINRNDTSRKRSKHIAGETCVKKIIYRMAESITAIENIFFNNNLIYRPYDILF